MTTQRNFSDFDNMLKGIHCEDDCVDYTAVLIVDKIKLERSPSRSYDVNLWCDEICYGRRIIPKPWRNLDNSDVGDIKD